LKLELDEFSEVKYLREGAALSTPPDYGNMSSPAYSAGQMHMLGGVRKLGGGNVSRSSSRPRVMGVSGRRAYCVQHINYSHRTACFFSACFLNIHCDLHTVPADYSRPVIVPFRVAMPNVNFPPGQQHSDFVNGDEMEIADGMHSYRYTAVITFVSGRTRLSQRMSHSRTQ